MYLLNLRKSAAQVELDQFFKATEGWRPAVQVVTKSAFFQARKQLSHTALIDVNRIVADGFYAAYEGYRKWNGFRLCAVDGSMLCLPHEADVVREFGVHTGKVDQRACPMGWVSLYFDVLNHLVIDARLHPANASERACAARHLEHAKPNDLVIYDRGYNAFWLYAAHRAQRVAFCMRAKVNRGLEFKRFVDSGAQQAVVTLRPNPRSVAQCIERGLSVEPIRLRLVRVDLPGEVEVLITNLMDDAVYDAAQFKSLYHQRWGCEENYKRFKHWVEIENFSGKSALSVKQDFHAKIVTMNLTALMMLAAQRRVEKKPNRKHVYRVNFAQALSKMKHTVVILIRGSVTTLRHLIAQTIDYLALTIEPVREARRFPRRFSNFKKRSYYSCYKRAL